MDGRACARCGTGGGPDDRFCTACGLRLDRPAATTPAPGLQAAQALVECDTCGAVNAASRPLCARCGTPLRDEIPGGDALPDALPPAAPSRGRHREGPSVLLALVILAGLITAGVLLALVTARVTAQDVDELAGGVSLAEATASSALASHPAAAVIDGDPTTAWVAFGDGDGEEPWVEVVLARPTTVRNVLLWNGDQADEQRFSERGRAAVVRIELGDRRFRVTLRDRIGAQAIDLPQGVTADRVRLVIEESVPGRTSTELAISEVVVEE
jgi:hypothetical protein